MSWGPLGWAGGKVADGWHGAQHFLGKGGTLDHTLGGAASGAAHGWLGFLSKHGNSVIPGLGPAAGLTSKLGGGVKLLAGMSWKGLMLVGAGILGLAAWIGAKVLRRQAGIPRVRRGGRHGRGGAIYVRVNGGTVKTVVTVILVLLLLPMAWPQVFADTRKGGHIEGSSYSSCGGTAPIGGLRGVVARVGHAVHGLTGPSPDPAVIAAKVKGTAQEIGTLYELLRQTALGAPVPTVPTVPTDPAQQVDNCPCGPTLPPGGVPAGYRPKPTDTAAQLIARAALAAAAADPAGWDPVTAVAVSGAEADYDPNAANPTSSARGPWQLIAANRVGVDWSDPYASAVAAQKLWHTQGWGAWVGYSNGDFRAFLEQARAAVASVTPGFTGTAQPVDVPAVDPALPVATCVPIGDPSAPGSPTVEQAIARAMTQLGVPYSWGGGNATGPTVGIGSGAHTVGFDCSGLVQYAYQLPGNPTTATLPGMGARITPGTERRGDLVFPTSGHVGIALGDGTMVVAPHTGDVVKVEPYGRPALVIRLGSGVQA